MFRYTQNYLNFDITLGQACKNPRRRVARTSKFCTVVANVCGSSASSLLHVTLLAPRILMLDFWKIRAPLYYEYSSYIFL